VQKPVWGIRVRASSRVRLRRRVARRFVSRLRGRSASRPADEGRVGGGRGVCRSRESLLPAAFALLPVPQSRP